MYTCIIVESIPLSFSLSTSSSCKKSSGQRIRKIFVFFGTKDKRLPIALILFFLPSLELAPLKKSGDFDIKKSCILSIVQFFSNGSCWIHGWLLIGFWIRSSISTPGRNLSIFFWFDTGIFIVNCNEADCEDLRSGTGEFSDTVETTIDR